MRISYPSAGGQTSWSDLGAFSVSVRSDGVGCSAASYRAVQPQRLLDTRIGLGAPQRALRTGETIRLRIGGRNAVTNSATTVVANLTATEPFASGWITAWPCGQPRPNASSLNFEIGQTVANLVAVGLGTDGELCLYGSSSTHLIVDLSGFQPTGAAYAAVQPQRLLDTRIGLGATQERVQPNRVVVLGVVSRGNANVAPETEAVAINLTVVDPDRAGWLTAWPCGEQQPFTSNLNFSAGQTVANLAIAKLGPAGTLCLASTAGADLLADLTGWYRSGATFSSLSPSRVLDTRSGIGAPAAAVAKGSTLSFSVSATGQVPAQAASVAINLTITGPDQTGFATVWPCGQPIPDSSNVNFTVGGTVPNAVLTKLGPGGTVCVRSSSLAHVVADLYGWSP